MTNKQNSRLADKNPPPKRANIGTVIGHHGATVIIEDEQKQQHLCMLRQNSSPLVVGDLVTWQATQGGALVVGELPRKSVLSRQNRYGQQKTIAANIDYMMITLALSPRFCEIQLNKYLVGARLSNITPIVVVNKIDLCKEDERKQLQQQLSTYQTIKVKFYYTSCYATGSLTSLRDALNDKVSVFVGQSGVGKSTLIKTLLSDDNLAYNEIKTNVISSDGQGRHTTSMAKLYHLDQGGVVIDSPGIREWGLGNISYQQLCDAFYEFKPYKRQCRFRNCCHDKEPNCAIKQAVRDGLISKQRLDSFHRLLTEINRNKVR